MVYIECLRHNEHLEKQTTAIKKSMPVTSTQSEQKQTMQRLHISTCAVHRLDLFTSNSSFDGPVDAIAPSPRYAETPNDALTAETPRLGGDIPASPQ